MAITLTKTLPNSSFYSGNGATTITLNGVTEISFGSKKTLIKVQKPRTPSRQLSSPSDVGDNLVIDLQRIEDTFTIKGWLEDDTTQTAWSKAWKLRAMSTTGGALTSLVLENLTFPTISPKIPSVFLENISFTVRADSTGSISTTVAATGKEDIARIEITLNFYIGDPR